MTILNWLKYWRASLADAESINIDISKVHSQNKTKNFDPLPGVLPKELFHIFWPQSELQVLEEDEVKEKAILISPLSLVPRLDHTKAKTKRTEISPFWFSAFISSENELRPGDKKYPLISRMILEPSALNDMIFSSVDKVDEVFAKSEIATETWQGYCSSVKHIFFDITGQNIEEFKQQELFDVKFQWVIIPDEIITGASLHILELYNNLVKKIKFPKLLTTITEENPPAIKPQFDKNEVFNKSAVHLGQMNKAFGLSPSQRKALTHSFDIQEGEILAVNGPPGTGKTTLIQSVIADNFIKAALRDTAPAITVASSTNNQAITNIIDSFSKGKPGSLFEERWIDTISSFALYMVSSDSEKIKRAKERNWIYHTSDKNESFLAQIENNDFISMAKVNFLKKFAEFSGKGFPDIRSAQSYLLDQIKQQSEKIEKGFKLWKGFSSIKEDLRLFNLWSDVDITGISDDFFETRIAEVNMLVSRLLQAKQREPFYFIFSFFKGIRERKKLYYRMVFHNCGFDTGTWDFSSSSRIQSILLEKSELIRNAYEKFRSFHRWKDQTGEPAQVPFLLTDTDDYFLNKVDTSIRYKCFYHAVHYWEARWLETTQKALDEDNNWKNTEMGTKARLQRFAMLCPCFVSTFHMLPKMMQYVEYPSKSTNYLFEFIDLLIVDEAGQVSPEVGVPSFCLAKKALVVGDKYQIEPVWNVDKYTDEGNLFYYDLYSKSDSIRVNDLIRKGFLSSNGSLMKLAQKSCKFIFKPEERGLMLTEHRRCLDQIIAYCNELVYDNQLEPLTTSKFVREDLLPPMGYLHIKGKQETLGSSRTNKIEAEKIIEWLKNNETAIIDWIFAKEKKESNGHEHIKKKQLHEVVGIITPFAAQKRHLTRALSLNGYRPSLFQYGTVHSLQGAEKDVVLFSPVYISENKISYFFDIGPNMLNVAVSRAKRSFIVAGDKTIFLENTGKTPSGLLGKHLKSEIDKILVFNTKQV